MGMGELTIGEQEARIVRDSLVQQAYRLPHILHLARVETHASSELLTAKIAIIREKICRGRLLNRSLLGRRKFCFKLLRNRLCNLALDGKDVIERAVVALRPEVRVTSCVD